MCLRFQILSYYESREKTVSNGFVSLITSLKIKYAYKRKKKCVNVENILID